MVEADGEGELRLLDQQLLTPEADTHTHTHTHTRGAALVEWWTWMHREQQRWDEPNPLGRDT